MSCDNNNWAMGNSSSRIIQNALILNLIIFLAGIVTHNIVLSEFSYATILGNVTDAPMLVGIQSYFALSNSSAIITGVLIVFAYAAVFSLVKQFIGRKKRSYELAVNC